ncbi:MAG: hypothetical protein IJZ90_01195 [Clostridia bacterium]|nr:hypothetical protein [Clostridia bacterium]
MFEGWVTDNGTAFTEYTKVSGDIIVYAKWTEDGR